MSKHQSNLTAILALIFIIIIILFLVFLPELGISKMSKKESECHDWCKVQQKEAVQQCMDSKVWPLSPCIKKASDAKKECLKQCG